MGTSWPASHFTESCCGSGSRGAPRSFVVAKFIAARVSFENTFPWACASRMLLNATLEDCLFFVLVVGEVDGRFLGEDVRGDLAGDLGRTTFSESKTD